MHIDPNGNDWNSFRNRVSNLILFVKNIKLLTNNSKKDSLDLSVYNKTTMGTIGGPVIDPNAPGWGEDGEWSTYQKVMGWLTVISLVGVVAGAIVSLAGVPAVGLPIFAVSAVGAIIFSILGGFGYADG